jgi:hypothetical protein
MMKEAQITISGIQLTLGESMTVRVAVQAFAASLAADGLGEDKLGKDLCEGYLKNIRRINELISKTAQ